MSDQINGGPGTELVAPRATPVDRFAQEVQTGLARYYEVAQENESLRRRYEAECLENERLRVQIEAAREHERAHVQMIVDEAKISEHKATIENSMLRDELEAQRRELAAQRKQTEDARAEIARLTAGMSMIGSNVVELLGARP